MGLIIRMLGGPIITYLLIGVASLGLAAWGKSLITAPYRAEIVRLKGENKSLMESAETKERLAENDRKRAEIAEAELANRDVATEALIHAANAKASTCKLSSGELDSLRRIAGTRR